jgi:hypothetical protein
MISAWIDKFLTEEHKNKNNEMPMGERERDECLKQECTRPS